MISPLSDSSTTSPPDSRATAIEALTTLFALGREVTSVLDLDELLQKIPQLIARLTKFTAFAVYRILLGAVVLGWIYWNGSASPP